MKKLLNIFCFSILLLSCQRLEENKDVQMAEVTLTHLALQQFNTTTEQARTQASGWEHIFEEEVTMFITNTENGQGYELAFNPNDFFLPKVISLPYGEYSYTLGDDSGESSPFLPFTSVGTFSVNAQNINLTVAGETDFALVTLKNSYIEQAEISGHELILTENEEFYYLYISSTQSMELSILDINGDSYVRDLNLSPYSHLHFYLEPEEGNTDVIGLLVGDFQYEAEGIALDDVNHIVYDQDGNRYRTVTIGEQVWMAENLRSTTFCNGDPIPHVPGAWEDWSEVEEPMWTYYDNDESNNFPYGKLYNGYVAIDERNPCPCGWRVPFKEDFDILDEAVREEVFHSLGALKQTGFEYWMAPNKYATNETNFGLVGGGIFVPTYLSPNRDETRYIEQYPMVSRGFNFLRLVGAIWSQTEGVFDSFETLHSLEIGYDPAHRGSVWVHDGPKDEGLSIRCIKESETL